MYNRSHTFQHRRFSGNRGSGRPMKIVPKSVLLAAIAKSKQDEPIVAIDEVAQAISGNFADFSLERALLENIKAKGFGTPTPIQIQAIPAILDKRDLIGMAQTGTGKTAAFLIPIIHKIIQDRAQRALVIVPTRELAMQIAYELRDFSKGLSIRNAVIIGGVSSWRQEQDLRRDPHIVIATPGRLKDLIESKKIRLSGFRTIVLDEADRMVDIGFIAHIQYFISMLPQARQSLFFSATISPAVESIMNKFVTNPVRVTIAPSQNKKTIKQDIITVSQNKSKLDTLHDLLKQKEFEKVLVFGRTKHGVQRLSDELARRGIKSGAIHGNKGQNQRRYVLEKFSKSEIQILLATDIASRGLDIPNVSHVINYDLPETIEDYTHRIGRTGRANKLGIALTFIE